MKYVAVPLELIHMGSLVHDDVIDHSDIRRGRPTVRSQWNNRVAMHTGNFIFGKAIQYVSHIEDPKAHQILARTMVEICNGEVIQIEDKYRLNQNLKIISAELNEKQLFSLNRVVRSVQLLQK